MTATVFTSVMQHGGRTSRYGDFTVVHMHGCSFITTPMEFMQMQNWARGRMSCGTPARDRSSFTDRFETLLARVGSGLTSRGNRMALGRIVKSMKANAVFLEEWSIPRDLDAGVEIRKRKPAADPQSGTDAPVPAAADEPTAGGVTPLVPK